MRRTPILGFDTFLLLIWVFKMRVISRVISIFGILCSSMALHAYEADKGAVMTLHFDDLHRTAAKYENSPWGEFWNSSQMVQFRKPFDKWWEDGAKELQKELKLSKEPKILDMFQGEVLFSLENFEMDFSKEVFDISFFLVFDSGKKSQLVDALKKKMLEEAEEAKKSRRKDVTFMGHRFHSIQPEPSSIKGKTKPKAGLEVRFGTMGEKSYFGMGDKPFHEKSIRRILKSKKGSPNEFRLSVMMAKLNTFFESALMKAQEEQKAKPPAPGPMMFMQGMNFVEIIQAMGFLDFESIKVHSLENKKYEQAISSIKLKRPARGFLKMFLPSSSQHVGDIPNWVPENAISFQASSLPISSWYAGVMEMIRTELPQFSPMVQAQMSMLKQNMGLDLEKGFFDLFDDLLYQLSFEQGENVSPEQFGQNVMVFPLKDGSAFEKSFKSLLSMNPALQLEPQDYMGGKIYQFPSSLSEASPTLAFFRNMGIFSQASSSDVKTVMRYLKKAPKKSLLKSKAFNEYRSLLPDRYQQVTFQNSDLMIESLFGFFRDQGPVLQATMDSWPFQLDFSALPKPGSFDGEFGNVFGFTEMKGLIIETQAFSDKLGKLKK